MMQDKGKFIDIDEYFSALDWFDLIIFSLVRKMNCLAHKTQDPLFHLNHFRPTK